MNQQHVGHDFLSSRIKTDVPKMTVPTITFLARKCPVCKNLTRTLVRPPHVEFQCEIGVECGCQGDKRYPSAYISFQGSFIRDGHIIVETLRGADGAPGRDGKDAAPPTREELISLLKGVLCEQGFWRRLFGRIK